MVDKDKIQKTLKYYFAYHGTVEIDNDGLVSCTGDVQFLGGRKKLPVRFGKVEGSFQVQQRKLTTLSGAPHTVGQRFICWGNQITSFEGAPVKVGAEVYARDCNLINLTHAPECTELRVQDNPLTSLTGMPDNLKVIGLTWHEDLPLLQSLKADEVTLYAKEGLDNQQALTCYKILSKYAGQGRPGAIRAAAELVKADLKGNARW